MFNLLKLIDFFINVCLIWISSQQQEGTEATVAWESCWMMQKKKKNPVWNVLQVNRFFGTGDSIVIRYERDINKRLSQSGARMDWDSLLCET